MFVDNEITQLKKVIVHFPNEGISRISPKKAETLLFDDIVFYPLMNEEYRVFQRVLHLFLGEENVLDTKTLVAQALENSKENEEALIQKVIEFEDLPPSYAKYLSGLSPYDLSKLLVTGYLKSDQRILFDPLPNYMFTRDIAVTIKEHILLTKAFKEARYRENLLTQFLFKNHPLFQSKVDNELFIDLNDLEEFPPSRRAEQAFAEGGDIMTLTPEYLLVGSSERSTPYAFEQIRDKVFESNIIDNVVQINIPNERSFMHIDTLFTMIDYETLVCFKPIVFDGVGSNVIVHRRNGKEKVYASIRDFMVNEVNANMNFIFSGGGHPPFQEREQWTDSCNLVALRPGVAISYDRNLRTLVEFEKNGYNVVDASDLFKHAVLDQDHITNLEKTIITIPSAELSRARGGSHCMTCPIDRVPWSN